MSNDINFGKLFDTVLKDLPLGNIFVWGEGLLQSIWPEFATVKKEVAYFVAY
ncbi:MAG: hypothetical protein QXV17_04950 [Candidatus Micrarchaeaceae archaeon]